MGLSSESITIEKYKLIAELNDLQKSSCIPSEKTRLTQKTILYILTSIQLAKQLEATESPLLKRITAFHLSRTKNSLLTSLYNLAKHSKNSFEARILCARGALIALEEMQMMGIKNLDLYIQIANIHFVVQNTLNTPITPDPKLIKTALLSLIQELKEAKLRKKNFLPPLFFFKKPCCKILAEK